MNAKSLFSLAALALVFASGCADQDLDVDNDGAPVEENVSSTEDELSVFQWSSPSNVTTVTSKNSVALANYLGNVHMVHTGGGGTNLYHTVYNGTTWGSTSQIPNQSSKNRPALAAFGPKGSTRLHMVHQGSSSDDLWWSMYDGASWTANTRLPMSSRRDPALAAYGGKLHLFGTYLVGQSECLFEATSDGSTWSSPTYPGICGIEGLAVATYNNQPIMVMRNRDNNLYMSRLVNGAWSSPSIIAGQKSQSAPTLAVWGGYLHMTHLGDTSQSVWWSYFDGATWTTNTSIPNTTSMWATSMAATSTNLVQAFPSLCDPNAPACPIKFQTFK